MPTAVRFYVDVLGFTVTSRSPTYAVENEVELFRWALLRSGEAELMLNTAYDEGERPGTSDPAHHAVHRDTGLFIGCQELDAAYAHPQANGVACQSPRTAPYGMRQLFFLDPDGYGITLQWPA